MPMKKAAVVAGVLALCLGAGCHERVTDEGTTVALAAEEIARLVEAEELGRRIYEQDQYVAAATRLAFTRGVDLIDAGVLGWIAEERPDGCIVTFVTGDPEQWRSVCRITFAEHTEPNIILVNKDLTESQEAMFNARQRALACVEDPCSDSYNTVVIPRRGEAGWLAYALAATTDPNLIIIGGHYRATVSADGTRILDRESFTRSCLVLRKTPEDMPAGGEVAAYQLVHLLGDTPTEIHVFLNLHCGKPLYVATRDRRAWFIEEGNIRLLRRR
jgi:hypothetical protein